jgi:hypothetical protein
MNKNGLETLAEIQLLCLSATLKHIPVLFINPQLSTISGQRNVVRPMLLGDFIPIYKLEDHCMIDLDNDDNDAENSNYSEWFGYIQRFASTFDVFRILQKTNSSSFYSQRIDSMIQGDYQEFEKIVKQFKLKSIKKHSNIE